MSKRRSNTTLKANRARSWQRGQERHKARDAAQAEAHRINQQVEYSPWEFACHIRAMRRKADPEVQRRRHQHEAGLR